MENSSGLCTENDSGELQTLQQYNSDGLQMENVSGGWLARGKELQWLVLNGKQ